MIGEQDTTSDRQLLIDILKQADHSQFTSNMLKRVHDFISKHGGILKIGCCAFCDNHATLLCDYTIGGPISGWEICSGEQAHKVGRLNEWVKGIGLPYISVDDELFTCDAPICESCAKQVGVHFACGRDVCYAETVDRCPAHYDSTHETPRPMEARDADRVRMGAWKFKLRGLEATP